MYLRILILLSLLASAIGIGAVGLQLFAANEPRRAEPVAAAEPPAAPPPARRRVLVAARALPVGTLLKDEDLVVREVSPDLVPLDAVLEDGRADLRGALLRRYVDPGASLTRGDVLRPRDRGFLAAVLRADRRAISIGVDAVTGTAGLIWPGDQVDVILTQELNASDAPLSRRVVGETVLADARVIAVDQSFTQGATGTDAVNRIARTVTLEVTAEQAERVAVASRLGRLSITVRSMEVLVAAQAPDAVAAGPVFGADVSQALANSSVSQGARMRVIQGEENREVVFR
ncbi:Flp pilus assembly protein CpaB [Roseomonas sp. CCTCC AB2023176]|uniref:Flp pilus assembly protein CpaB n=1 Tax=Roseomonas sp. CCTCC AB2023176 TaxID=3342640 RepID=UPI0035E2344C